MTLRILGGQYKGRILHAPKTTATRPTQGILRQAVFNICQHFITGARFLDLFAGSGAMGLEALSRGAAKAVFVEQDRGAIRSIRENIELLHVQDQATLLSREVFSALKFLGKEKALFDLIYIDPPYGKPAFLTDVLSEVERQSILAPNSFVFIETSSQEPEFLYESDTLRLIDARSYGIAKLHQFKSKHNLYN